MGKRAATAYPGATCPHCGTPLDLAGLITGMRRCASCGGAFEALRFAAPARPAGVRGLAEPGTGGETACAAHPGNAAVSNCERCGVFMCALCQIESDEMKLCPACFERLSAEGALSSTRTSFRDYGRQASTLALAGIPLILFGALIGLCAVYYGIRSLVQLRAMGESGGRSRAAVSILAGVFEMGLGTYFLYSLFTV